MRKGQSIFLFEMPEILHVWNFLTVPTFALGFYEVASVDLPPFRVHASWKKKKKGIVINIATDGFKHNTTNQGIFSNPENGPCSKGTSFWISSKGIDNISLWNGNEVEFSGTKFCSVKTSDSEPALQQSFIDERTGSFCLFVCFLWRAAIYGRRREGGGGGRAPATKPAIAPSQRCSS